MAQQTVTTKEGKRGVNETQDIIDLVLDVKNRTAYVDLNPGISDKNTATFGWEDIDEGHYPRQRSKIDTLTDDEIRLKERTVGTLP